MNKYFFDDPKTLDSEINKSIEKVIFLKNNPTSHGSIESFGFFWFSSSRIFMSTTLIDSILKFFPERISPEVRKLLYDLRLMLSWDEKEGKWHWIESNNGTAEQIQNNFKILDKALEYYKNLLELWITNNKA